ncbi:MAG TPA: cupin domain-containing protein [Gaiellaceae bacterium]|nr:cupin domain-containing protein [Gaiellaceae bacterium]
MNLLRDEPQRFGEKLGATRWGGTLYELGPGDASRYHWQVGEEEWLVVIAGRPTLRTPDGERVLEPWDTAVCVRGEAGAHQLKNETDEPVRVAWFSTISDPEVVVYPDEDRIGVVAQWSRDDRETIRGWVDRR